MGAEKPPSGRRALFNCMIDLLPRLSNGFLALEDIVDFVGSLSREVVLKTERKRKSPDCTTAISLKAIWALLSRL